MDVLYMHRGCEVERVKVESVDIIHTLLSFLPDSFLGFPFVFLVLCAAAAVPQSCVGESPHDLTLTTENILQLVINHNTLQREGSLSSVVQTRGFLIHTLFVHKVSK